MVGVKRICRIGEEEVDRAWWVVVGVVRSQVG